MLHNYSFVTFDFKLVRKFHLGGEEGFKSTHPLTRNSYNMLIVKNFLKLRVIYGTTIMYTLFPLTNAVHTDSLITSSN